MEVLHITLGEWLTRGGRKGKESRKDAKRTSSSIVKFCFFKTKDLRQSLQIC